MRYDELELLTSAARTTSGNGIVVGTFPGRDSDVGDLVIGLDVTAASGTSPTLDVDVVGTINGVDFTLGSFTQKTTTGQQVLVLTNAPRDVKVSYTIAGTTPSFTFSVQCFRKVG